MSESGAQPGGVAETGLRLRRSASWISSDSTSAKQDSTQLLHKYPHPSANICKRNVGSVLLNDTAYLFNARLPLWVSVPHNARLWIEGREGNAMLKVTSRQAEPPKIMVMHDNQRLLPA
jgi:hypothetical protein